MPNKTTILLIALAARISIHSAASTPPDRSVRAHGLPVLILEAEAVQEAKRAGFRNGISPGKVYRVATDQGEMISLVPPEAVGDSAFRVLRVESPGVFHTDTLPLASVKWVEFSGASSVTGSDWLSVFGVSGISPLLFGVPEFILPLVYFSGAIALTQPGFGYFQDKEIFAASPSWTGEAGVSVEAVPRAIFSQREHRRDWAQGARLHFDFGKTFSGIAFSTSLRAVSMRRLWRPDPFQRGDYYWSDVGIYDQIDHRAAYLDSLYAEHPVGLIFSPSLKFRLWQSPRLGLHVSLGNFAAWLPGADMDASTGATLEIGTDIRLTETLDADLKSAFFYDLDDVVGPSFSAGLAYHPFPRPQQGRRRSDQWPRLSVNAFTALLGAPLEPGIGFAVEPGRHFGMGFGLSYQPPERVTKFGLRSYSYEYPSSYATYDTTRSERFSPAVQLDWHTDKDRILSGGWFVDAGFRIVHSSQTYRTVNTYYTYDYSVEAYRQIRNEYGGGNTGSDVKPFVTMGPAVALKLWESIYFQGQCHLINPEESGAGIHGSAGLSYRFQALK